MVHLEKFLVLLMKTLLERFLWSFTLEGSGGFLSSNLGRPCMLQKKTERGFGMPGVLVWVGGDPSNDILEGGGAPSRDLLPLGSVGVGLGAEPVPRCAGVSDGVWEGCDSDLDELDLAAGSVEPDVGDEVVDGDGSDIV